MGRLREARGRVTTSAYRRESVHHSWMDPGPRVHAVAACPMCRVEIDVYVVNCVAAWCGACGKPLVLSESASWREKGDIRQEGEE